MSRQLLYFDPVGSGELQKHSISIPQKVLIVTWRDLPVLGTKYSSAIRDCFSRARRTRRGAKYCEYFRLVQYQAGRRSLGRVHRVHSQIGPTEENPLCPTRN